MRDADIDLARLQARKDALVARYQARAYVWQATQGAALAALGFGVLGRIQDVLSDGQAQAVAGTSVLALLAAAALLRRQDREFQRAMDRVDEGMENLKAGGAP